jgi:hypothetical protein
MKTLTVRLPDALAAEIAAEARRRRMSKSDIVRKRLERPAKSPLGSHLDAIQDLIGSVHDALPADLSANVDFYVKKALLGRKDSR